jgi:hypothetical protein
MENGKWQMFRPRPCRWNLSSTKEFKVEDEDENGNVDSIVLRGGDFIRAVAFVFISIAAKTTNLLTFMSRAMIWKPRFSTLDQFLKGRFPNVDANPIEC